MADLDTAIRKKLADWHRQYFGTAHPLIDAVTAVVDLHKPEGSSCSYCIEFVEDATSQFHEEYPCATVRAIAEQLGVSG